MLSFSSSVSFSSRDSIISPSTPSISSWIHEKSLSWFYRLCLYILRRRSVPRHVAVIMDGNRRFATKKSVKKVEGHLQGFNKLTEVLQWCQDAGINELTVFAFSIENFKRTKEETDALMELARKKFRLMIEEWQKLRERGICVRVIGNLTLLPKDLIFLIIIVMLITKDNNRTYLNIAFSYTGKDEILNSFLDIANGIRDNKIKESEITETFLDQCLYTYQSPPPELVIRTSGEFRISDFLTWQISYSYIHFVETLWPEFSTWNFMCSLFSYQQFAKKRKNQNFNAVDDFSKFVDTLQKERLQILVHMCGNNGTKLDYQKLELVSAEEIYVYYKNNFIT